MRENMQVVAHIPMEDDDATKGQLDDKSVRDAPWRSTTHSDEHQPYSPR